MMQSTWDALLTIIKEEMGSRVVETWFKAISCVAWDSREKRLLLKAPNSFVEDWVTQKYLTTIERHAARLLNEQRVSVSFSKESTTVPATIAPQPQTKKFSAVRTKPTPPSSVRQGTQLHDAYRFDTCIVGPHNDLAVAAARAVAEKPGTLYNPLFIYGASGLGKTHLLHAIGNHARTISPTAKIVYQSADRFIQEFITAIRFNRVYEFEARYRSADILLLDDIQSLSNKEQTQEAFFNIFNMLHTVRKQIVITSDSMARDIAGLAERIRSRLEGGLVVDIQPPQHETKVAILKKKAELHNELLADDVADMIALRSQGTIRELEGMLIRVLAFSALSKQEITTELVNQVLVPPAKQSEGNADLPRIASCVAQHYGCTVQDLRSPKRNRDLTLARHVALYLMKRMTSRSLREIGSYLERRDHTTVLHACEKIGRQEKLDKTLSAELSEIVEKIHRSNA